MRLTKDFLSGMLFLLLGIGGILVASSYNIGTPARMGPGFFPVMAGGILCILGLALSIKSKLDPNDKDVVGEIRIRPIFFVSLAIVIFGFLIQNTGIIAALAALILISRLGSEDRNLMEGCVMVLAMSALVWVVFVQILNIRLPLVAW